MYIYGILNSNASLHLSVPKDLLLPPHQNLWCGGVEESEPRPCTQERDKSNGIVYTTAYQDISAVVSDSEMVDTSTSLSIPSLPQDGERKSNRNPERAKRVERIDYTHMRKDILARLLIGHQTVIERIMAPGLTIIPMRLGTFAISETEVKEILNKGYNLIKHIFEKIEDKIEIDVVATWRDFCSPLKEIGEEKEIKNFREKFLSNPKGVTVDEQIKVGVMVKKALDEKREKYAKKIQDALKTVSQEFRVHELMDDRMVANFAFLINRTKNEDFERIIEKINAEFNEKLNFRCVGPLPAYSFFTLEIKIVKNEDIDWAKKKLGILNDITSKDELKKAYRRQAFSTHPDKNPNNPYAGKEFDEVNRAHKILSDYCVAIKQANPVRDEKSLNGTNQQDKVPFDREMFKENTMLVRVRE